MKVMKDKIRNPYFWIGIISIIFASAGIDFNSLTSWSLLGQALISIINNPVAIMAVIGAVVGVFNDNSTSGLDKIKIKK
jgi:phi LC3 family holin